MRENEIKGRLTKSLDNMNNILKQLNEEKEDVNNHYNSTYKDYISYDKNGKEIRYSCEFFENLYAKCCLYINKQISFVKRIIEFEFAETNKLSVYMENLLDDFLCDLECDFPEYTDMNFIYEFQSKIDYSIEYNAILVLAKFSNIEDNIVLIGGNGSGKSSFAKTLKGNDRENISVIPAQKTLYFTLNDMNMLSTRLLDLKEILLENNIYKSKDQNHYEYFQFQNNQFTKLIVAMKEQHVEYLLECEKNQELPKEQLTIYGKLRNLFRIIFPEIELDFNSNTSDYLNCKKNGKEYHVNGLSEGEKAVIYYAVSVFMAKENSFIVVDEPETYLNPSLTNVLWDLLIQERCDCQFIFITHSVDFVLGRSDAKIAWIKSFYYPSNWEIEFVENNFDLPKTLLTEVLGTQKPILFCEGNDKASLDYRVYRALLGENYTIIPLGGHLEVIKNFEVLSAASWMNIEVSGLVDGDNYSDLKKNSLREKGIRVLPFNEIEMFMLSDIIMEHTLSVICPLEFKNRIEKFKEEFWKNVEKEKEKIVLTSTKLLADEHISKEKVEKFDNIDNIKESIQKIANFDVQKVYDEKMEQITKIITERNYGDLLIVCNLKEEISKGLANRFLDSNYVEKAVQQIITNAELKKRLIEQYFQ